MVVRHVKRVAISIVGGAVLLIGVALLVLPGPGFLVIAAGFAILATEFDWAQRWLDRTKDRAMQALEQATQNVWGSVLSILFAVGMVVAGVVAIVVDDLPFANVWTGASVILGGLILLATTIYAIRTPGTGHYPPDAELPLDPSYVHDDATDTDTRRD
jgi:uncharacterized protein (TIGR02611 family)